MSKSDTSNPSDSEADLSDDSEASCSSIESAHLRGEGGFLVLVKNLNNRPNDQTINAALEDLEDLHLRRHSTDSDNSLDSARSYTSLRTRKEEKLGVLNKQYQHLLHQMDVARKLFAKEEEERQSRRSEWGQEQNKPIKVTKAPAPRNDVAITFTDIQGSTVLWNLSPVAMRSALKDHNKVLRRLIRSQRGYEVKTEGDAFMIAFPSVKEALLFCVEGQLQLLRQPFPTTLHLQHTCDVTDDGLWNGLRVRMGFHGGNVITEEDPITQRVDYFGPTVNLSARVCAKGKGGQIVVSKSAHTNLTILAMFDTELCQFMATSIEVHSLGLQEYKGFERMLKADMELFCILPTQLKERKFSCDPVPSPLPEPIPSRQHSLPTTGSVMCCVALRVDPHLAPHWAPMEESMRTTMDLYYHCLSVLAAKHDGKEVAMLGDQQLVGFASIEPAIQFATSLQEELLTQPCPPLCSTSPGVLPSPAPRGSRSGGVPVSPWPSTPAPCTSPAGAGGTGPQ
eukprot:NODE_484_length_2169_cov_28.356024_g448_i0.p1 GENE.NODE_484_length_2169_cov_28.356024_g448_i0~~NODE_484_length_2169_cov_28.356024_g448_i0.p1  ORF type:complete len:509 (+),score=145.54 NODE_484_length_2169_cov_28.356024_g448_i0:54-1580(+)